MSHDIIHDGALRLESALQEMHAVNLLHAHVKSSNVVLNQADRWHLTHHGACADFGQPVHSCTEVYSQLAQPVVLRYSFCV